MPHASFHAVSVKSGRDAAGALNSAMATVTKRLHEQFRAAEASLDTFRLSGISHSHTITTTNGMASAVVTAIASYEYR